MSAEDVQRAFALRSVADGGHLRALSHEDHAKADRPASCPLGAHTACPCISDRLRELERNELTPEERQAVVLRITGAQTVKRMPDYRVHLESARRKLADGGGS